MRSLQTLMGLRRGIIFFACSILLNACGGSDKKDSPPAPNQSPSASAGSDFTATELSNVVLDGTATTDPNAGDIPSLSYTWTQTAGSPSDLILTNSTLAQASFTAPDVVFGAPQQYTFQLSVSDAGGLTDTDTVTITIQEPGPDVTVSGTLEYEFVPAKLNCQGLDFFNTQTKPIRGATVQVLDANNDMVLGSTVSDDNGFYSFTIASQINVYLRVRAELKKAGTPSWDVEVRDNTTNTGLPLPQRPLYVLDGASFNTGVVDSVQDLLAETGWNVTSYTSTRAAAPFSILDAIYDGMLLMLTADADAQFVPLDAFWSVNNNTTQGTGTQDENIANGELGSSFYRSGSDSLFLLGMADDDTEEFDDHVIAHEWGHYFEDNFSRSDSIGGAHSLGNRLDMRVAFGEGWGTAISGMATGSPRYCDSSGASQSGGFGFNIENQSPGYGPQGWFNEVTIARLLYDLWDTDVDGVDNDSIGFGPIFEVMTSEQASTDAFTSIFTFMTALKANNPGKAVFIDALLTDRAITTNMDIYGSMETNDAGNVVFPSPTTDVLPLYYTLTPSVPIQVCSNDQFDDDREGNKVSEERFLRFDISSSGMYEISVTNSSPSESPPNSFNCQSASDAASPDAHRYSDPDFAVFQNENTVAFGLDCTPNEEVQQFPLSVGPHVMSVVEFRYADDDTVNGFPQRSCFDVSVTPVP